VRRVDECTEGCVNDEADNAGDGREKADRRLVPVLLSQEVDPDIGSKRLADLRGKKVNFGPAGSASSLTGTIVFQRAGVQVEPTNFDNQLALQKLKSGEIAALVRVINKPIDFFAKIPANSGLHLVPISFAKAYEDLYALGEFTSKEYPTLVPPGQVTDTIAVPAVLAVFNWQKNTDRYRKVQRFVEAFFTKF